MDDALPLDDALAGHVGWVVTGAQLLHHCFREAAHGDAAKLLAVPELQAATDGAAQRVRLFHDRLEHRHEVAGRAVDDLQHLGRRSLLLQRLARLGDEPRILHCDDGLRREVLEQRDLLVAEWPHLLAVYDENPKQGVVFAQRDPQCRASTRQLHKFQARRHPGEVSPGIDHIRDMHHSGAVHNLLQRAAWIRHPLTERFRLSGGHATHRQHPKALAVIGVQQAERGLTEV